MTPDQITASSMPGRASRGRSGPPSHPRSWRSPAPGSPLHARTTGKFTLSLGADLWWISTSACRTSSSCRSSWELHLLLPRRGDRPDSRHAAGCRLRLRALLINLPRKGDADLAGSVPILLIAWAPFSTSAPTSSGPASSSAGSTSPRSSVHRELAEPRPPFRSATSAAQAGIHASSPSPKPPHTAFAARGGSGGEGGR